MNMIDCIHQAAGFFDRENIELKCIVINEDKFNILVMQIGGTPNTFHVIKINTIYGPVEVYKDKYERR